MPTEELLARAARAALAPVLFDIEPPQAIVEVEVAPEPEAVTIRFRTSRPCFATVELFRMVTGRVDLDLEKENRERIEIELFGDARL